MGPLYQVENGKLTSFELEQDPLMRRGHGICDMHVHSKYSGIKPDLFIATRPTRLLGVRESYSEIKKIYEILQERGATVFTISDHNSVLGALEMRQQHPDESYISCEYTVNIQNGSGSAIHCIPAGIDYIGDLTRESPKPLSDKEVLELHQDLLKVAEEGHKRYQRFCDELFPDRHFLAHPASQVTPKYPMDGAMLDELTDTFTRLELSGDYQEENIIMFRIVLDKSNKNEKIKLVAGRDAHTILYLLNTSTVTKNWIDSPLPYNFLKAVQEGEIGVGSRRQIPKKVLDKYPEGSTLEDMLTDIVKYRFNGTIKDLQMDSFKGGLDFIIKEKNPRKYLGLVGLAAVHIGLSAALSAILGPEYTLSMLLAIEGGAYAVISAGIPVGEKLMLARTARRLYHSYQEHRFNKETEPIRAEIEEAKLEIKETLEQISSREGLLRQIKEEKFSEPLPEIVKPLSVINRALLWLIGRRKAFQSDYDGGKIKRE